MRRLVFALSVFVSVCGRANAAFLYADFASTTGLNLVGSAANAGTVLRLTPNTLNQAGGAWYSTKQDVQDGFDTTFTFQMAPAGGSDGIAFLIQNSSATALFGPGARLGYGGFGTETGGIPNSIAIQFDTFQNAENNDPNNHYVSVQSRGVLPNSTNHLYTLNEATLANPVNDGAVHQAELVYSGQSHTLALFLDNAQSPTLLTNVNLSTLLSLDSGTAYVGFTAGTGDGAQNQDILSWQFKSTPEPSTIVLVALGSLIFLMRLRTSRIIC